MTCRKECVAIVGLLKPTPLSVGADDYTIYTEGAKVGYKRPDTSRKWRAHSAAATEY